MNQTIPSLSCSPPNHDFLVPLIWISEPMDFQILPELLCFIRWICYSLFNIYDLNQNLELAQTHAHGIGDAIQPFHPLSSPSPAFNLSQHQGLFI